MQNLAFAQNVGATRSHDRRTLGGDAPGFSALVDVDHRGGAPISSLDELYGRPSWHQGAECRGRVTARFVQGPGTGYGDLRILERCPVREECLEAALADPDLQGLWGGTNDRERRQLRRAAA